METTGANPLISAWRTWQFAQSLSGRTVTERIGAVIRMEKWIGRPAELVDHEDIVEWLAEGGDWSARTRSTYHNHIRSWFHWLQTQGHRQDDPMLRVGKPKTVRCEPRPLTNQQAVQLLGTRMRRRTRAMILLALFQGLRVHEIAKVKAEHLDLVARTMVVKGKGGVVATVPLHHRVVEHAYQMPRKGYWFPGPDRGRQRRESISGTIKEAMIRAGVPGSAHCCRHWFGTALVEAGVDIRTIQTLMRHQNLASTAIYTEVSAKRRAAAIDLLDPYQLARATAAA